jgi:hypothetical protein
MKKVCPGRRSRLRFGFAVVALSLALTLSGGNAFANPQGLRGPEIGKKLFSFNVIVFPGDNWSQDDTVCQNNGNRIFFNDDGGSLGTIDWLLRVDSNPNFNITDCDGTVDNEAVVVVNQSVAFWVAVRLVGPAHSSLSLTCTVVTQVQSDDLCLIDNETIKKSGGFTKVMHNLIDDQNEEVLWTLDNSLNAKILQVWIMEDTGA